MRSDFNCNMQKHSKYIIFLICLQFSVINILYTNAILSPKQVICLEKLSFGVYILAIFTTGNMASRVQLMAFVKMSNAVSLQYIANAPLINNPARKLCAIKLRDQQ
jgi:hypothetical protein